MVFVACGLNHKTAPLPVREKLALTPDLQTKCLTQLMSVGNIQEVAILSTCNRTELYCQSDDPTRLPGLLADIHGISHNQLKQHLYAHTDLMGVRHTLRVASGLDSMMLGEPQILGQMKQAYQQACKANTVGTHLRNIFPYIFNASKYIRHESQIGHNPVSIASVAAQMVSKRFHKYKQLRALIIGSGETAALVGKYLQKQGVTQFTIASRTPENARQLASHLEGNALPIAEIPRHLALTDVVISATACPVPFITTDMVKQALTTRENEPMVFIDLAVPRDIESEVGQIPYITLYNIDDLHAVVTQGMQERHTAALKAEQLIDNALDKYHRTHRGKQAKNLIRQYRTHMQALSQQELQRALKQLSTGQCEQKVLEEFSNRLVNKLLHKPSTGLRMAAQDGREDLLELADYLFSDYLALESYENFS